MSIRRLTTLQTPVFLINSRLGRFSAARFGSPRVVVHLQRAPLLPKLRGHFAEFLLRNSLEHLRLLASPTCVRLGTVTKSTSLRGFSWQYAPQPFAGPRVPSASALGYSRRICLSGNTYHLTSDNPPPDGRFCCCVPP